MMTSRARAVSLGVLSLAVLVVAAWAWHGKGPIPTRRQELAVAVGRQLPFPARLSGGFAPSNVSGTRTPATPSAALSPDARIALATLEKDAGGNVSWDATADLGVVHLIHGDIDRAISLLRDAASETNVPLHWSDLSAAYLVKAMRTPPRRIEFLARGFEAATQSIMRGATNEALFNRALALEGLAPYVGEPAPWANYVRMESDPRWIEMASSYLAQQHPFEDASARWEARRSELRLRLAGGDTAFVRETVTQFPEASLEHLEQDVLVSWATARERADDAMARDAIEQAELLANALADVTGDHMARDHVTVLRRAGRPLARAHRAYATGVDLTERNNHPQAKAAFEEALQGFSTVDNPYQQATRVRLATAAYNLQQVTAAEETLAEVESIVRRKRYPTLLARILWVRGLIYKQQWRLTEALYAFNEAAAVIEPTRQREFGVNLDHLLANNLRMLGEQQQSWEYLGKTLDGLALVRKPTRRYISLYNASLFATSLELHEAALVFHNATVREATKAGIEVKIDAVTQRAAVHLRRGDRTSATGDLREATGLLEHIADGSLKNYLNAEIDVLYARLHSHDDAAETTRRITSAIQFFDKIEPSRIPGLYLDLARSRLAAHAPPAEAAGAIATGIDRLDQQQTGLNEEALKISYFDESWELYDEMVALQLGQMGDAATAFEFAERSRARSLLASTEGTTSPRPRGLRAIREGLPEHVQLVFYYVLRDKLLTWLINRAGTRLVEQTIDGERLIRSATQFRTEVTEGRIGRAVNDELFRLLWSPVAHHSAAGRTIVLIADGELQQVPFATLRDPRTGRHVIEDYTILLSPSASFYVLAANRSSESDLDVSSALLVGNPASDGARLPAAEREVTEAAQFYARREILVGPAATKAAFLERAPRYDVVHFGGHAVTNPEYPLLSRLVFSADRDGGALFAHEIAQLRFPRTKLVILAACSTARGTISRGEGALSIARPFLAGGVPVVIASQWDVDDRATSELFLAFHREFAVSKNPAEALRKAQLTFLRDPQAIHSSPASWGAFVALGATTH